MKFCKALLFYSYNGFVTNVPSYTVRHAFLRYVFGISIGDQSSVHAGCFLAGRKISIGDFTAINRKCYLDGRTGLRIGNRVSISPETYILSLTHDAQHPDFAAIGREVHIEDYVWIGARAIILPGVTLGTGCVVGAGSVVTKDVAPFTIVAGLPAVKIGERNKNLDYKVVYFPFFNSDLSP